MLQLQGRLYLSQILTFTLKVHVMEPEREAGMNAHVHREANSVCICMCIYVHLCEHGGQILILGIFLNQPDTDAGYLSQSLPALFS